MSEKKYTILISAISCMLALVLALCSVTVLHAEETNSLIDADWKYIIGDNTSGGNAKDYGLLEFPRSFPADRPDDFPELSSKFDYVEKFSYVQPSWFAGSNITCGSNSEIVLFYDWCMSEEDYTLFDNHAKNNLYHQIGRQYVVFISKSPICYKGLGYMYSNTSGIDGNWSSNSSYDIVEQTISSKELLKDYYTCILGMGSSANYVNTHNLKVFTDAKSLFNYLDNCDSSGLAWQGGTPKQTYSSELLLNDFDVQFHDSNKFEECYLDVKYTIPDSFKSVSSFQIDMEERFDWIGTISGSVSDVTDSHTGTNYIDVLNHADGFRIYLKDIKAIDNFINKYDGAFDKALKRFVLGNLNYVNFPFSKYIIGTVKTSNLNIKFHLVAEKKYGHYVDYNLNLLSGVGVKKSYIPDTEGNYTSNNDTKVMGHYYADVGTDAAGNTTYNYYYYYSDGGKEKISAEDATNNTVTSTIEDGAIRIENNPVFNNTITVEGDNIRNEANSYADSRADSSTNKSFIDKFLGFFDIIENNTFLGVFAKVFSWLPVGVSSLITTALGIVVGIRVFKFFK